LIKEGNSYLYTSKKTGKVIKMSKKEWHTDEESMKVIMNEFTEHDFKVVIPDTLEEGIEIKVVEEV